jgi:hypothetical protein
MISEIIVKINTIVKSNKKAPVQAQAPVQKEIIEPSIWDYFKLESKE